MFAGVEAVIDQIFTPEMVARRSFWTAIGDACEREGVVRGWADAAIVTPDRNHVVLERVRCATVLDVPLVVRGGDRFLDLGAGCSWGAVRPSGAVEGPVADVVADRLLSSVGWAGPRMDLEQRDVPLVRAMLGRLAAAALPAPCSPQSRRAFRWAGTATTGRS